MPSNSVVPKNIAALTTIVPNSAHNLGTKRMFPGIEAPIIRRPANERHQTGSQTNLGETDEHATTLQSACLLPHQPVKQKKIDRRDDTGRKRQSAMPPSQSESKEPVQKKIRSNRQKTNEHWGVAFADRVKSRRQHLQSGIRHQADGVELQCARSLPGHLGREPCHVDKSR